MSAELLSTHFLHPRRAELWHRRRPSVDLRPPPKLRDVELDRKTILKRHKLRIELVRDARRVGDCPKSTIGFDETLRSRGEKISTCRISFFPNNLAYLRNFIFLELAAIARRDIPYGPFSESESVSEDEYVPSADEESNEVDGSSESDVSEEENSSRDASESDGEAGQKKTARDTVSKAVLAKTTSSSRTKRTGRVTYNEYVSGTKL